MSIQKYISLCHPSGAATHRVPAPIYEVFPRHFGAQNGTTGRFTDITARLDEFRDQGIQTLWLMGIFKPGEQDRAGTLGSPFSIADFTALDPDLGTQAELEDLIKKAHGKGLKVILDAVCNHTAKDHPWTASHPEYYLPPLPKAQVYGDSFSRYQHLLNTDGRQALKGTRSLTIQDGGSDKGDQWPDTAQLNIANPQLRRELIDSLKHWVDLGVDGFHCDMAMLLLNNVAREVASDYGPYLNMPQDEFWKTAIQEVRDYARDRRGADTGITFIAEAYRHLPELVDCGFTALDNYGLYAVLKDVVHGRETPETLKEQLIKCYPNPSHPVWNTYLMTHDEDPAIQEFAPNYAGSLAFMMFLDGPYTIYNGEEYGTDLARQLTEPKSALANRDTPERIPHFTIQGRDLALPEIYKHLAAIKKQHLQKPAEFYVLNAAEPDSPVVGYAYKIWDADSGQHRHYAIAVNFDTAQHPAKTTSFELPPAFSLPAAWQAQDIWQAQAHNQYITTPGTDHTLGVTLKPGEFAIYELDPKPESDDTRHRRGYRNFCEQVLHLQPDSLALNRRFEQFKNTHQATLADQALVHVLRVLNGTSNPELWQHPIDRRILELIHSPEDALHHEALAHKQWLETQCATEIDYFKFRKFQRYLQQQPEKTPDKKPKLFPVITGFETPEQLKKFGLAPLVPDADSVSLSASLSSSGLPALGKEGPAFYPGWQFQHAGNPVNLGSETIVICRDPRKVRTAETPKPEPAKALHTFSTSQKILDFAGNQFDHRMGEGPVDIAYMKNGLAVVSGQGDRLQVMDVNDGHQPEYDFFHRARSGDPKAMADVKVNAIAASRNGRYLVTAGHTVRLIDLEKLQHMAPLYIAALESPMPVDNVTLWQKDLGHEGPIIKAALSRKGKYLATAGAEGQIKIFSLADPKHPQLCQAIPYSGDLKTLVFDEQETMLALGIKNQSRQELSLLNLNCMDPALGYWKITIPDAVFAAFQPYGQHLAIASDLPDTPITFIDLNSLQQETRQSFTLNPKFVNPAYSLGFSPNGRYLMAGDDTNYIRAIDMEVKEVAKKFQLPPRDANGQLTLADSYHFQPGGARLLYGSRSGFLNSNKIIYDNPGKVPPDITPEVAAPGHYRDNFQKLDKTLWDISDNYHNGQEFGCTWKAENVVVVEHEGEKVLRLGIEKMGKTDFSGAEIRTKKSFGYGRFGIRMKAAKGDGIVSSFFTYCGPRDNNPWEEIDIEFLGKDTTRIQLNYYKNFSSEHWDENGNWVPHVKLIDLGFDAADDFHDYEINWQPNYIEWRVDGRLAHRVDGTPDTLPCIPARVWMNFWNGYEMDGWLKHFKGNTPYYAYYEDVDIEHNPRSNLAD